MGNANSSGNGATRDYREQQELFLMEARRDFTKAYSQEKLEENNNQELVAKRSAKIDEFSVYQTLGSGAFATVVLSVYRKTTKLHALKILNKRLVVKQRQIDHAKNEKRILNSVNFPFFIRLDYFFQDYSNLYMALEFVPGGELFTLLRSRVYFNESTARFYASQVVLALEYLHYLNVIYRDLKPENILIGADGYLKIADFGFAKLVPDRTYTLCGTPEYLAPEIITNRGYGRAVDWWAFGILIYEFVAGYSPFYAEMPMDIYEKILACKLRFPPHFSKDLRGLIRRLVEVDLTRRFGNLKDGVDDIKQNHWFRDQVDWYGIFTKVVPVPLEVLPKSKSACSVEPIDHINPTKKTTLHSVDTNHFGDLFVDF